ncbi:hypothetical protein PO124_26920 [Bacillus licheniformis]|nr:hypothetical protein [Bacillus licheniformis]
MDVGNTNEWNRQSVVAKADIIRIINEDMPIEPIDPNYEGEVANDTDTWTAQEKSVYLFCIRCFCTTCNRARLSAKGELSHVFRIKRV